MATIPELLANELVSLRRFCDLLDEERKALTGAKAEALPAIVEQKSKLANQLSALEAGRDQLLLAAGLQAGRGGMDVWLKTVKNPKAEHERWESLLELASKARSENETNGRLINLLLQQNQEALSVLLSGGGGSIYGPDGQHRNLAGKRSFGSV